MSPDVPAAGRTLKLAICVQTEEAPRQVPVALFTGPLAERAAKAAAAGADGLELMPVDPARLDAAAIRSLLAEHGLSAAAIGSGAIAFSTGLTLFYIERLKKYDPLLHCVITLTEERALREAAQADAEIAAGKYRGMPATRACGSRWSRSTAMSWT